MDHEIVRLPFGYLKVQCKGNNIEKLFNSCIENDIKLWSVQETEKNTYQISMSRSHFNVFKKICAGLQIKVVILEKRGLQFLLKDVIFKKEILISLILSVFILFILSNLIWSVEINGLPEEIEEKVSEQLDRYGVRTGNFIFNTPSPSMIQQHLINEVSELLWIGVEISGTSYKLEGVEKLIIKKDKALKPRDLVASKDAIVKDMQVRKGLPIVHRNDYVKEDDLLISGVLNKGTVENDEKQIVAAEGDIIGETWYEVEVAVSTKGNYEQLTGRHKVRNFLEISSVNIPLFIPEKKNENDYLIAEHTTPIKFLLWSTPIHFKKQNLYEIHQENYSISDREAIKKGKKAAVESLKREIGEEITVKTNKVLQETKESGKVNLILFVALEENIVKSRPINQGD